MSVELPPLRGDLLLRLRNDPRFDPLVERALATSTQAERNRERRDFLRRAALFEEGPWPGKAGRLVERMRRLARRARLESFDPATLDGQLAGALLMGGGQVPSELTVWRAFTTRGAVK